MVELKNKKLKEKKVALKKSTDFCWTSAWSTVRFPSVRFLIFHSFRIIDVFDFLRDHSSTVRP